MEVEPWGTDFDSVTLLGHAQWLHGGLVDEKRGCLHASPLPTPPQPGTASSSDSAEDTGCL